MKNDQAEYQKSLDNLEGDKVEAYAAERSVIRLVVEVETKAALKELFGEKYRVVMFQKSVEMADEKLLGIMHEQKSLVYLIGKM